MKIETLGPYKTLNSFVSAKINRFNSAEHSFRAMFELMFSEKENVIYEKSSGYQIEYTKYGEACDQTSECAAHLRFLLKRLPDDSIVGLYMKNDISWIIAFWAILKSGHRPLLLNTRLGDDIINLVMRNAGASAVITDGKTFPEFETIPYADIRLSDRCEQAAEQFGSEVLVMSSGTTALPKICAYSAEEFYYQINDSFHIICECRQIKKHYDGQLKLLTFLPFYHVFGLIAVYIWFAFFSRTFVHLSDLAPQTIINTIRRHKVTHIFAVPMFWNEVYKQSVKTIKGRGEETYHRFLKGMDIAEKLQLVPVLGSAFIRLAFREVRENLFGDSICFLITGGSEIQSEVLSFFNLIGYHLANGYGMTEIGITSVELSTKRNLRNAGYVGKPFSSIEYRISPDGCLQVSGRSTARYIMEGERKKARDEWFDTGDIAECVNGHYRILGRRDDVVISESGENLNPFLIEPLLADDPNYQICLIGHTENRQIVPTLLVFAGRHVSAEKYRNVRRNIEKKLQDNRLSTRISNIVFVQEPLISPDDIKINRARLRKQYDENALSLLNPERITDRGAEDDPVYNYVRELFAAAFGKPAGEFGPDTDFFLDEGGSSLDYFALISKIQEDHDIRFPASQEKTISTIAELSAFIEDEHNHVG